LGGREYFELQLDDDSVVVVYREVATGQWYLVHSTDETPPGLRVITDAPMELQDPEHTRPQP